MTAILLHFHRFASTHSEQKDIVAGFNLERYSTELADFIGIGTDKN